MRVPARPGFLLGICVVIVIVYAILFQVMAKTRLIEKVMAYECEAWELLLIVLFLFSRLATYLIVPAALLALGVYTLLSWRWRKEDWSEEYK